MPRSQNSVWVRKYGQETPSSGKVSDVGGFLALPFEQSKPVNKNNKRFEPEAHVIERVANWHLTDFQPSQNNAQSYLMIGNHSQIEAHIQPDQKLPSPVGISLLTPQAPSNDLSLAKQVIAKVDSPLRPRDCDEMPYNTHTVLA